ncbi:MAG: efflux RND transporter permease subunit [Candidatus Obscuribacterales bacterium]
MYNLINSLVNGAIRARYVTLIAALVIILAGLIAWTRLPLEAYPELSNPQVRIISLYPGKGAEEAEKLVTIPLEKELYGIPRETALRSLSLYGLSVVTITFSEGTDSTLARQRVLERIHQASLPNDVQPHLEPDVGSLREIYRYSLQSPYYSPMGLRSVQQWEVEKLFRQIPGVIGVVSEGGPTKTYQVLVDPHHLRAYDVTLQEVFAAIECSNATSGGGFMERNGQAMIVRQLGLLQGESDIERVVVKETKGGIPIRVKDVADVSIGPMVRRGQVGQDNEDDAVEGIVLLRRGENPSTVLAALKERLPEILSRIPAGISFETLYDRSGLVQRTLQTVGKNVTIGISLVLVFLCIFLVDFGSAAVTAVVIPISILVAFIFLTLLDVPANLLSLGAIDFGILVDSAVVMTENVVRRLSEEGRDMSPRERLLLLSESAREVAGPIVSGIAVIIATFLPIFTFAGVEGRLFRPLAVTMVTALIGAGLAAITIIPVILSFLYSRKPPTERESPLVTFAKSIYRPTLKWSLRNPILVICLAAMSFGASLLLFMNLGSEFLPHLEEGNIWLRATVKPGSVTLEESVKIARKIRLKLLKYPEVTKVLSQVGGPDDGTDPARFADQEFYIGLKPADQWRKKFKEDKQKLIADMRADLESIPNVGYYFTQYIQTTLDEALSGVQGSLVAKVSGADLGTLEKIGQRVGRVMSSTPGIVDVIVDPLLGQPQVSIKIDRNKAARYGLNVSDLRNLVEIAIGGKTATTAIEGERRFDVTVRLKKSYRESPTAIEHILVDTPGGIKIPLSQLAAVEETVGATQIWRDAGSRLATIRANVRGRDLATAVADAQKRVERELKLPEGYRVAWSGEFERQQEATHQLAVVVPVTLALIIVILYLACGTLTGALVMFSVVPLAAIGAILALYLTGTYFSISAGVGFIALFGLAVKNGILLVSFISELRHEGSGLARAVYNGAIIRMRPVLMTAIIAAVGLLPAAISNEIGAQSQRPFAIVIIGGLISCTFLTLYVLPAIYLRFSPSPRKPKGTDLKELPDTPVEASLG